VKDAVGSKPRTIPVGPQLNHCAADVPRSSHRLSEESERPIGSRRSDHRLAMTRRVPLPCVGKALSLAEGAVLAQSARIGVRLLALLPPIIVHHVELPSMTPFNSIARQGVQTSSFGPSGGRSRLIDRPPLSPFRISIVVAEKNKSIVQAKEGFDLTFAKHHL
jgi:hypothetical protein